MGVYNKRLDYPATQCAGTSVEGERVRAAARPHPTSLRLMTPTELVDAIRWMCTEMPVGWEEIAKAEGRSDVVETVRKVLPEEL